METKADCRPSERLARAHEKYMQAWEAMDDDEFDHMQARAELFRSCGVCAFPYLFAARVLVFIAMAARMCFPGCRRRTPTSTSAGCYVTRFECVAFLRLTVCVSPGLSRRARSSCSYGCSPYVFSRFPNLHLGWLWCDQHPARWGRSHKTADKPDGDPDLEVRERPQG
eukprot:SAG11_NODE_1349_length_5137_cov_2.880905_3_plen_168_part_00